MRHVDQRASPSGDLSCSLAVWRSRRNVDIGLLDSRVAESDLRPCRRRRADSGQGPRDRHHGRVRRRHRRARQIVETDRFGRVPTRPIPRSSPGSAVIGTEPVVAMQWLADRTCHRARHRHWCGQKQGNSRPNQLGNELAFVSVLRHRGHTAKKERVVGDDDIHTLTHRLVDSLPNNIDNQKSLAHRVRRIPCDETDRIAGLSGLCWPPLVADGFSSASVVTLSSTGGQWSPHHL
jgi:hypothetical protein